MYLMKKYSKMWIIPLLLVMIMGGCGNRESIFNPPDITVPTVSSTNPGSGNTGVAFNQKIAATFSEPMDSLTLTTATFTLMQGASFVSGTVSYTGVTATFAPAGYLEPNTAYTATITTMAKSQEGIALAHNFVWSFTTGATATITPPSVSSTDPADAATDVALNQKIAATFSVAMDATTITASTFTIKRGTTPVSGFVSYSGTTAIFAPASNLEPNKTYTITITTGAKDLADNPLAHNYTASFTTGASAVIISPTVSSIDPAKAETGVALNQKIAVTFSKTMDATTITTATFTLTQGTTAVSGFVSYSGTTAIFAPASNLEPNKNYTVTITTGAEDLAGNALANDHMSIFTTGSAAVVTPPTVSSTDPASAERNVALNQKIAATFSKTMDASTITTATFTLMRGVTPVAGFVSYSGTTAIFAPASNLLPNSTYNITITTGATDLAGNALADNYESSFTTGVAAVIILPQISSTDPADGETDVALNQKINATFSKTMDASTITTATFTLMQGTTSVSGFVSYTGTTAIFAPASNLAPSTEYTATITTGAKDLSGNALLMEKVWNFTTGAAAVVTPPTVNSTDPADVETGVALNQKIAATFSKTMNASTITTATFTLTQGTTSVSGFVSYTGTTAIFAPASNLAPSTYYTATITTGAKDLAGNAMATNKVWHFTTGTAVVVTPPTVSSTDPINNEECVALDKHITATFNKTMNASTITTAIFTLMEVEGRTFVSGTVSYVGTTATFIPLIDLKQNTTYTATITTGARDLSGNALATNKVWNFTTVIPYTVTLSRSPLAGGTVSGSGTFYSCASVTVTATPNAGYTFTNWTESGVEVSNSASYTFTLNGNRALVANFTAIPYTVTLSKDPLAGGTVSGGGTFNSGASVTVTALANAEYTFVNWTEGGAEVSTDAIYTFTISANRALRANFTIKRYTVSLSRIPLAGGTVSAGGTFNSGASVTVTATVNAGYTFTNWTESGVEVSTDASYTFTIMANRALVANFTANTFTVSLTKNPVAGGTVSGGGTFTSGASVTVTALANAEYTFVNWTEGGVEKSTDAIYTFVLSANRALVANFAIKQYTISLSRIPLAGGTVSGSGTFNSGASRTVTATVNDGYSFTNWTESGVEVSTDASFTFTLMANRALVANFALSQYRVTLQSSPANSGNLYGAGLYDPGSVVTVLTSSKPGYKFVNWTESGVEVSANASYTFPISEDITLVANFETGQLAPVLGTSARFAILSNSDLTNIPTSDIRGDVGISPGARSNITGFSEFARDPGGTYSTSTEVTEGFIYAANDAEPTPTMLIAAKSDAEAAYLDAVAAVRGTPTSISGNINGLTLYPGLYESGSSIEISAGGFLYLDAMGDANAVFVIRSATSITTESTSEVVLAGNAQAKNIYWVAGSAMTLGTYSKMKGTLIASTSISLLTGSRLDGRALIQSAAAGQISLDQSIVILP